MRRRSKGEDKRERLSTGGGDSGWCYLMGGSRREMTKAVEEIHVPV